MITINQQTLDDLITAKQDLDRLKRQQLKSLLLAVLFGWLAVPIIVAGTPFPKSIKEVVAAINVWYSDVGLNLQCRYRK